MPKINSYFKWCILLFFAVTYFLIVVGNHYYFRTFCFDYATFNQCFYAFAHLKINQLTTYELPVGNIFQCHLSFTLVFLAPLYWIFGWIFGTYTLLILQVLFMLFGGYGVYKFIKQKSESEFLANAAMVHYFLLSGHLSALSADFMPVTVVSSMIPWFLYHLDQRKYLYAALLYFFIVTGKENMSLWFMFISLFYILINKNDRSAIKTGVIYFLISGVYFFLFYPIFFKVFEDPNYPYSGFGFTYSALGSDIFGAVKFIIRHPVKSFYLLFENQTGDIAYDGIKAEFYYVLLLSGGVLLFLRPFYLIPLVPLIAQKMYNDDFVRWGLLSHYSMEVVSVLSILVFCTILSVFPKKYLMPLTLILLLSTGFITMNKLNTRTSFWYLKEKEDPFCEEFFNTPFDVKTVNNSLKSIPPDAAVCASERVAAHLAFRSVIRCFPYKENTQYIVILKGSSTYPLTAEQMEVEKSKILSDTTWIKTTDNPSILIFKKAGNIPNSN